MQDYLSVGIIEFYLPLNILSGVKFKRGEKMKKNTKNTKKAIDYSKGIFAHYHHKMRDEIEFSETDFYEDNIYDEPDYRRSPTYKDYDDGKYEIRP